MGSSLTVPRMGLKQPYKFLDTRVVAGLARSARSLMQNLDDIVKLSQLPNAMFFLIAAPFKELNEAEREVTAGISPADYSNPALRETIRIRATQRMEAFIEGIKDEQIYHVYMNAFDTMMTVFPEIDPINNAMKQAMLSLYSSLLVGTWTAFETLLGDLWEAAVNTCPRTLAELKGGPKRIEDEMLSRRGLKKLSRVEKDEAMEGLDSEKQDEDKQVSLKRIAALAGQSFDLGSCMGTLLRDRYTFSNFAQAREAYSSAFFYHSDGIVKILSDTYLDALHRIRNVIVHKAWIADDRYVLGTKGTPAPQVQINDRVQLNEAAVVALVNKVASLAVELVEAVDEWIKDELNGKHKSASK